MTKRRWWIGLWGAWLLAGLGLVIWALQPRGGTATEIQPYFGLQRGAAFTGELRQGFERQERAEDEYGPDVYYLKYATWELGGKPYDVQIHVSLDDAERIGAITIGFKYPGGLSRGEVRTLDRQLRRHIYRTYQRSIIEVSNRDRDWPGLVSVQGAHNTSLVYEYAPDMWMQIYIVPTK